MEFRLLSVRLIPIATTFVVLQNLVMCHKQARLPAPPQPMSVYPRIATGFALRTFRSRSRCKAIPKLNVAIATIKTAYDKSILPAEASKTPSKSVFFRALLQWGFSGDDVEEIAMNRVSVA
jgi:hypothetical protein